MGRGMHGSGLDKTIGGKWEHMKRNKMKKRSKSDKRGVGKERKKRDSSETESNNEIVQHKQSGIKRSSHFVLLCMSVWVSGCSHQFALGKCRAT